MSQNKIVTELESVALLPFERRKHQLVFSNRAAEEYGDPGESRRRRVGHQIGHLSVEGAINNHTQGTFVRVMLGNEKHGAPEIRIEHARMSDQQ